MNTEANFQSHHPRCVVRQKSLLRARIRLKDARTSFDCMIRDISSRGARLHFSGTAPTPDVFELYIPQKEQMLRANVTWRCGENVGVAFAHQTETVEPSKATDLHRRVDRLESEIDAFKQACKKFQSSMRPIRI
jgi:hypothetical protein